MAYPKRVDLQDVARLHPANDNRLGLLARGHPVTVNDLIYFAALHVVAVGYLAAVISSLFD